MSPQNYLKVISGHKTVIILCVVLVALLAFTFALVRPESYNVLLTLSIYRVNREETADFQYDNYYAIQAAELMANTVVNWLVTPDTVLAIFEKAGLAPEVKDLAKLSRRFKPRQLSAHVVRVEFRHKDQEEANRLSAALVEVVREKVKHIEKTAAGHPSFEVQASVPITVLQKLNPFWAGGLGLVCGLFLGIGLAFLFEYLKKEE